MNENCIKIKKNGQKKSLPDVAYNSLENIFFTVWSAAPDEESQSSDYAISAQKISRKSPPIQPKKVSQSVKIQTRSFITTEILVIGVILLLVSTSAFISLNQTQESPLDVSDSHPPVPYVESTDSIERLPTTPSEINEIDTDAACVSRPEFGAWMKGSPGCCIPGLSSWH